MPLDDKEKRILAEIERQFYEEDPHLAHAVRHVRKPARVGVRLSALGVIVGLAVVLSFFAVNTIVAFLGFGLLVASATMLVTGLKSRSTRPADRADVEQSE